MALALASNVIDSNNQIFFLEILSNYFCSTSCFIELCDFSGHFKNNALYTNRNHFNYTYNLLRNVYGAKPFASRIYFV